tara:strand:+ start:331 stop:678 length:348 start_codon:yes stop_codon:yes gene_type:complete
MGKRIKSLLERLDEALGAYSSETKKSHVYAILAETAILATSTDFESFYTEVLRYNSLVPKEDEIYEQEDIESGQELESRLREAVILPKDKRSRNFGRKYRAAREKEFEILKDFYK